MKVKTSELTGAALDWAVAMAENWAGADFEVKPFSTDWAQGGPIIERDCICIKCSFAENVWSAWTPAPESEFGEAYGNGPTPLAAAMRCYVASKMGDEVDAPDDLVLDELIYEKGDEE